eukprot:3298578-Pyramimonas_sp.AAC.1
MASDFGSKCRKLSEVYTMPNPHDRTTSRLPALIVTQPPCSRLVATPGMQALAARTRKREEAAAARRSGRG